MYRKRILIIHHEANIQQTIAQYLEASGYEVSVVESCDAAQTLLVNQFFDLILLDLEIPGTNCMKYLGEILHVHPESSIIVSSSHASLYEAIEAMKLGAVDFLQEPSGYLAKPLMPEPLLTMVQAALEKRMTTLEAKQEFEFLIQMAEKSAGQYEYERATLLVNRAIGLDPSRPEGLTLLGKIEEAQGDRLEALKKYRAAIDLDPTYQPAHQNLDRATTDQKSRPRFRKVF